MHATGPGNVVDGQQLVYLSGPRVHPLGFWESISRRLTKQDDDKQRGGAGPEPDRTALS